MRSLSSTAVMQRRFEDKESLDDFPTPPWATRALIKKLHERSLVNRSQVVREPAANRGYMVRPLEEFFHKVEASDVADYGMMYPIKDFLNDYSTKVDWTITNPPFVLASDFIHRGLETSNNVAVILRIAFLEGKKRWEELFSKRKPDLVFQFVERVPMVKGRYDPEVSSATAYAWFVWTQQPNSSTELDWIEPCKKELIIPERDFVLTGYKEPLGN